MPVCGCICDAGPLHVPWWSSCWTSWYRKDRVHQRSGQGFGPALCGYKLRWGHGLHGKKSQQLLKNPVLIHFCAPAEKNTANNCIQILIGVFLLPMCSLPYVSKVITVVLIICMSVECAKFTLLHLNSFYFNSQFVTGSFPCFPFLCAGCG